MAAIGSARYFWDKEVTISGSELRVLQNMIQMNVIDRLQLLPVNDKSPPIDKLDLQHFKDDTWRLTETDSVSDVISKLQQLKTMVIKLAGDMNVLPPPLAFFQNNESIKAEPAALQTLVV